MTTMIPTTASGTAELEALDLSACTAGWREALVELLVLAEHGDVIAARRLRTWLSADPVASAVSSRIARDLTSLRV